MVKAKASPFYQPRHWRKYFNQPRKQTMNKRVRFQLDLAMLVQSAKTTVGGHLMARASATRDIKDIFTLAQHAIDVLERCNGAMIECSPEQFVRFLIWRNENGLANNWACLNVKMIDATGSHDPFPTIRA